MMKSKVFGEPPKTKFPSCDRYRYSFPVISDDDVFGNCMFAAPLLKMYLTFGIDCVATELPFAPMYAWSWTVPRLPAPSGLICRRASYVSEGAPVGKFMYASV